MLFHRLWYCHKQSDISGRSQNVLKLFVNFANNKDNLITTGLNASQRTIVLRNYETTYLILKAFLCFYISVKGCSHSIELFLIYLRSVGKLLSTSFEVFLKW